MDMKFKPFLAMPRRRSISARMNHLRAALRRDNSTYSGLKQVEIDRDGASTGTKSDSYPNGNI